MNTPRFTLRLVIATLCLLAFWPGAAAQPVAPALPLDTAFPAVGATNVNPDTPLRLTFPAAVTLGRTGKIHLVETQSGADAETIEVGQPVATQTIGGEPNYRYYPVIVADRQATIYPRHGALGYGRTYRVVIDAGTLVCGGTPCAALDGSAWTFTTKPAAPAAGSTRLVVAADGSGDFSTVQGALDFIPAGNNTPTTVFVRKGTYNEIVFLTGRNAVSIIGEDRQQTVIAYATNNQFNPTTGNPFGDARPNPSAARVGGNIYHRGVFLAHRVQDLVLANLTIRNTTPQGGTQAEAIILNGTTSARAILKDLDLYSYQDTVQINGQAFISGCHIEGDVDFMWGTGPCFFEATTCRSLRSGAYYTQIRNPATNHGYVYVGCTFDGMQGVMGNYLSRIGTGRFPHSEVVLIDCTLTQAVGPVAWQFQGGREGNEHDPAQVHFWEFNSHDPAGKPVKTAFRLPGSRQLTEAADAEVIASYRNPTFVLGDNWNPKAAPVFTTTTPASPAPDAGLITTPPASQIALLDTPVALTVATRPAGDALQFQWLKNGQPLPGATGATLRIPQIRFDDAAVYAVVVRSGNTTVTSAPARLTAVAPQAAVPPNLPRIPERVFDVTAHGARGDGTTDNTTAIQNVIDAAVAAGGGIVTLPASARPYLCGPLVLGNGVNLEIAAGATLQLLPYSAEARPGTYPLGGRAYANFLTANNAHDVAITGTGTINGDGDAWWTAFRANKNMPHRPFLVRFNRCERVLVSGVTFTRSPMFHVAISADHLTVFGIRVDSPEAPNTDGVDPAGSHHLIQNCWISCGDDNVVMKPGGAFCSDITIADCAFGEGHGLSVGGQTNRGLDGMTVKNCSFVGTTSGLRLKADPTQGGDLKNVSYSNLTMEDVDYPVVFYSYYNKVGNPGAKSGSIATTLEKVASWNATPPNSLSSSTLPSWRNITVSNVFVLGSKGYSIIWGLPLEGYLIDNVKLANFRSTGTPGLKVFDATNVQITGDSDVGELIAANALVLRQQPRSQTVMAGATVTLTTEVAGVPETSGVSYQWQREGKPLQDGMLDGVAIAGAKTAALTLTNVTSSAAGKYTVVVSAALDGYDVAAKQLVSGRIPVTATSATAVLKVDAAAR